MYFLENAFEVFHAKLSVMRKSCPGDHMNRNEISMVNFIAPVVCTPIVT